MSLSPVTRISFPGKAMRLMSDGDLAEKGRLSFEWARSRMPVLKLAETYVRNKLGKSNDNKYPLRGLHIAACLHISRETAVLLKSFQSLGLVVRLVAANPLSSQSDIISFLSKSGIEVHARRGETVEEYNRDIAHAAKSEPDLITDDGGDLHVAYSKTNSTSCFGGTDETTSGTVRLKALDENGNLRYCTIPVNEARTKHLFDNRYGTGQSALDGLLRATGILVAGKVIVVAGYGWVGRGVADRIRGLGGRVIVTEVDPIKALEASFEGFEVLPMQEACPLGDIFLTCTGQISVIAISHFSAMKSGAIIGNVGHFNEEIDVRGLYRIANKAEQIRDNIARLTLTQGSNEKSLFLLNQGRVVNLVSGEGHPPEIMQLSFANQLLSICHLIAHKKELAKQKKKVLNFPEEIDSVVARFALNGFGLRIDRLSRRQAHYSRSFRRVSV